MPVVVVRALRDSEVELGVLYVDPSFHFIVHGCVMLWVSPQSTIQLILRTEHPKVK